MKLRIKSKMSNFLINGIEILVKDESKAEEFKDLLESANLSVEIDHDAYEWKVEGSVSIEIDKELHNKEFKRNETSNELLKFSESR